MRGERRGGREVMSYPRSNALWPLLGVEREGPHLSYPAAVCVCASRALWGVHRMPSGGMHRMPPHRKSIQRRLTGQSIQQSERGAQRKHDASRTPAPLPYTAVPWYGVRARLEGSEVCV